jgi:class 3 adenylate cyclase
MSFRRRLFLVMLLLVAAVTGAALWIAERSMSAAFTKALDARFEERVARIARVRELRAEDARALAGGIAQSVRLQAGLIEYALEGAELWGFDAYENALIALDQRKPGAGWTLRVMDPKGRPLPGENKVGLAGAALTWKPDQALVAALFSARHDTQGLLPATAGAGWWEAYVAPIEDVEDGKLLGGLLVARFTTRTDDEATGDMRPGLLLGGRAVTGGWPPEIAATFSTMAATPAGRREIEIDGELHAIFWRQIGSNDGGLFPPVTEICAFSLAEREQQQRELRRKVLAAGAAALAVAALVALALANGLAKPVRQLVTVTEAIRRGDYTARATPRGGELGTLAEAFNAMTSDLALKDKYRNMLDLVSDPHIAEDLIEGGLELGGEEREVSVVFCDIRGFTQLSEGMEPKAVIEMLNEHFTPLTRVVYENGGVVLHFVGDLIIALFGAPRRSEHAERSAAACALGLIAERARLNAAGGRQIEVGIGVATGRMVAGRMGSKDRLNYSVFGARMNLAARLCSQAGPMQVVIDAPTLAECGMATRAQPLGALKLKGFSGEIEAFQLLALDSPQTPD